MTTPTYVYGLIASDTELPDGLEGLGPSGKVSKIAHGEVAAIVSDVPVDRPLGMRKDLLAHEAVVDAVAASSTVLPMRFPAVVQERGSWRSCSNPWTTVRLWPATSRAVLTCARGWPRFGRRRAPADRPLPDPPAPAALRRQAGRSGRPADDGARAARAHAARPPAPGADGRRSRPDR